MPFKLMRQIDAGEFQDLPGIYNSTGEAIQAASKFLVGDHACSFKAKKIEEEDTFQLAPAELEKN